MLDVPDVHLEPLGPVDRVPAVDLGPPGETRTNLESTTLSVRVSIDVRDREWPRTDQTHPPGQHVDELREFVETGAAKQASHSREPIRIGQQLPVLTALGRHGGELGDGERRGAATRSALTEDHRRADAQANHRGDREEHREERDEQRRGHDDIEHTLRRIEET